jgi:hypothetical protein
LIRFFEYSNSKEFLAEPDVFEYDQKMGKPVFDLIIGCNSMEKLGIVMDFKAKSITIDEIILPMRNIANLISNQEALPTSARRLLVVLENIEKIVVNSNAKEKAMKESSEKATGKHKKGNAQG